MELLSKDLNWIAFVPYPEEVPALLPDLDLPPLFGKVLTLRDALTNPAFDDFKSDLTALQRLLQTQRVFRSVPRQLALVGGLHGLHLCTSFSPLLHRWD